MARSKNAGSSKATHTKKPVKGKASSAKTVSPPPFSFTNTFKV